MSITAKRHTALAQFHQELGNLLSDLDRATAEDLGLIATALNSDRRGPMRQRFAEALSMRPEAGEPAFYEADSASGHRAELILAVMNSDDLNALDAALAALQPKAVTA